ncbi:MAG: hypothetical protein ABI083_14675 [Lapillicoccus sp.]
MTTVIQSVGISKLLGVRLPVVAGATFTVLNPMIVNVTNRPAEGEPLTTTRP